MPTILVPFHQDDRLADGDVPAPADAVVVEPPLPEGERWSRLAALYEKVADQVAVAAVGGAPVVLSGDCVVMLGTVAGVQRAGHDPGIVWIDAHGDLHTYESSASKYLGGMAFRWLLGADPELLTARLGLRPVAHDDALLVDARDLDPAELDHLTASGLKRVSLQEVAGGVTSRPMVVHVDLDVIDPGELPGLKFPVAGGPDVDDLKEALARLRDTGRVMAWDIACPWHSPQTPAEQERRERLVAEVTTVLRS